MKTSRVPLLVGAIGFLLAQVAGGVTSAPASAGTRPRWMDAVTFAGPTASAAVTPTIDVGPCGEYAARSTHDRRDDFRGRIVHIVYLVPADSPDQGLDRDALQCSVTAWARWFTEASGGLMWRLDTYRPGGSRGRAKIDITFVRSASTGGELLTSTAVEDALRRAGLDDPQKLYLSYVAADAGNLCGSGRYPLAELSEPTNPFGGHGRYAQVYLLSDPGCRATEFGVPGAPLWVEATAMQEMLHTEGVTPAGAPHSCTGLEPLPTHVCTPGVGLTEVAGLSLDPERIDVMFPFASMPLAEKVLDRGNDDYFRHPLPLRDLANSPYVTKAPSGPDND